jgi:DNA repair protein RadA/Sms
MNTVTEISAGEARIAARADHQAAAAQGLVLEGLEAANASHIERWPTGLGELDRVLGGGLPRGAAVVLGGEPGIGKSTLLAQVAGAVAANHEVLYVTAEESTDQVRARLHRLGVAGGRLQLTASDDAQAICGALRSGSHRLVVVDSIQLVRLDTVEGEAGGTSQVRACAAALVEAAKRSGTALVLVGHVTKDGSLAGPRLLEHLVDTVLAFEGDRYADLRTLRAVKNRYGATNEIGLFRMEPCGLVEVADPTGMFLGDRDPSVPGSCVCPVIEGNRCLLVEVQALVNPTEYPQPARRVAGVDTNRVAMVLAVLSRRLRLPLGGCDVFVNLTGGARVGEPAVDLAVALAIASAWREIAVPADLVAVGEVGLGGELRPAPRYELRAAEARRLGFKRLLGPGGGAGRGRVLATRLDEAVRQALDG